MLTLLISSVQPLKLSSVLGPNVLLIATSISNEHGTISGNGSPIPRGIFRIFDPEWSTG